MEPKLCQLLLDINEFGLKHERSNGRGFPVGPRFYMKCGSNLWFLLFAPGKNEGMASGFTTSAKFPPLDHFEEWEAAVAAEAEKDREMAEIFDKKLVDEVSRLNIVGVFGMKKLAGWEAYCNSSHPIFPFRLIIIMVTSITTRSDVLYHIPTLDPFLHILSLFAFVLPNRTFRV